MLWYEITYGGSTESVKSIPLLYIGQQMLLPAGERGGVVPVAGPGGRFLALAPSEMHHSHLLVGEKEEHIVVVAAG
ncbi:MAG TPA: hypothetical protein DCP28_04935, partial [Cytophagales bacterium]|nr:hypothetical protein [Cytophagales bacterium]